MAQCVNIGDFNYERRHSMRCEADSFFFGDVHSSDYHVFLVDVSADNTPRRDISFLSVPGRNGSFIVDNNRFDNVDVKYKLAIADNFGLWFDGFIAAILSKKGYQTLSDSIHPEIFRMAIVKDPISPETMRYNRTGVFDVTFNCKPQKYLKKGMLPYTISIPTTIYNPEMFQAKPIITVFGSGSGTVTIGETSVEIKEIEDKITLDCDLQNAYRQVGDGSPENMNGHIHAPKFPELVRGYNNINWSGGITSVEVIPRWWRI